MCKDAGQPGAKKSRPALDDLLNHLRLGDAVVVTTFMTPVGRGVVMSLSQTWYDLVSRTNDGGVPRTVAEVRAALDRVVSIEEKRKLVASKKRVPLSVAKSLSSVSAF
ncbi:hypothetical protein [Changpingibacter yushuensis]|uniref:hypothetical protein n=1 Tax=Changpingibacter yushuensis TaxID=2758440 RepID=UPI0015F50835|nr:hypothetical protein [Changpingibacter yushuensis]